MSDARRMAAQLVDELCNYLAYLQKSQGYQITLHRIEKMTGSDWLRLLPYNYHDCAVCREMKSSLPAWRHCEERQQRVLDKAEKGPFVGTCYAGVTEAVFPICSVQGECVGFLCVSGYTADEKSSTERACAAAARYGLPQERLRRAAAHLKGCLPDMNELAAQVAPVQTMLRLLFHFNSADDAGGDVAGRDRLYRDIQRYVNSNCRTPGFSLREVCEHFNVSYSFASRLFASCGGMSFAQYVRRIRIEAAKRYLAQTTLTVTLTAAECGFSDSNYFASVFRREVGVSPSEYRQMYMQR